MVLCPVATLFAIYFGRLELGQILDLRLGYFTDYWNCIDITSLYLNCIFLYMAMRNLIANEEIFRIEFIETTSAFGIFLMWLKVFYWCRLFSSLSYYVKLIQQVIIDSAPFMVMVGIIHFAFASFLFVCNRELVFEGI